MVLVGWRSRSGAPSSREGWQRRAHGGVATSALGTPHPPSTLTLHDPLRPTACVDGPPSRFSASAHPRPPLSGGAARNWANAVASAVLATTRITWLPAAHTAVRSAC